MLTKDVEYVIIQLTVMVQERPYEPIVKGDIFMKTFSKLFLVIALILCVTITMFACKKNKDGDGGETSGNDDTTIVTPADTTTNPNNNNNNNNSGGGNNSSSNSDESTSMNQGGANTEGGWSVPGGYN